MPDVVKHAWTHRPRAQGGTDPIEVSSGTPWATATMFSQGVTPADGYYTMLFDTMGTNSPTTYQLTEDIYGVEILEYGYYRAWFGVSLQGGGTLFGANEALMEPMVEIASTPTALDTSTDTFSDWNIGQFNGANWKTTTSDNYAGFFQIVSFNYENGVGDLGDESPLKLGVRVLTTLSGDKSWTAQIHVERVDDAGYTLTDLDA